MHIEGNLWLYVLPPFGYFKTKNDFSGKKRTKLGASDSDPISNQGLIKRNYLAALVVS